MKSYLADGDVIQWVNGTGSAVASGAVVAVGMRQMGIAAVDIASAATGSVAVEGVFTLTKTTGAIVAGSPVYWDSTNSYVVNAPAKNAWFLGYATDAATSGATTVNVDLCEFIDEGTRVLTLAATGNETLNVGDFGGKDLILLVPNTGAKTLSLPGVATIAPGARLTVRKTTSDAYAVTLDPNASELIDGGATHATIDASGDRATFVNSGSAWLLVTSTIA